MKPFFELKNNSKCGILITDLTQASDEYLSEDAQDLTAIVQHKNNKFKYSETCTINIIEKHTIGSDGEQQDTIAKVNIDDHCSYLDEFHFQLEEDGYYTIHHIILPTKSCIDKDVEDGSTIDKDLTVYSTDGETIYQGKDTITALQLININPEGTTISKSFSDQFSICRLWDCFIKLCKQIFKNINFRCLSDTDLKDPLFRRDLLWMTINIIKYHVDLGQLWEAQRLLQEMNYCGGLCNDQSMSKQSTSRCGCSKRP